MSYVNDEGETNFDPVDFTQFIPFGGFAKPVSSVIRTAERDTLSPVIKSLGNLFKKPIVKTGVGATGAGAAVGTSAIIPKFEIGGKAAVTGTVVAASGLASLFTLTQTQSGKDFAGSIADAGKTAGNIGLDLTSFIKQNGQLFSIFLIIAGVAIVIGAVKK